ncbi:MAG: hypothetical protein M1586_00660 [Patescibacteria group bacterium]|nr:hypothetical protein [Patescibacteria group bacterium]MCL5261796.1 hypothetical protein [Patescibacteria group bacterium]
MDIGDIDALRQAADCVKKEGVQNKTGQSEGYPDDRGKHDFQDRLDNKVDERQKADGFRENTWIEADVKSGNQPGSDIKTKTVYQKNND